MSTAPPVEIIVREQSSADDAAVDAVEREAFGQPDEARIVQALRQAGAVTLSLVAEVDGQVVGHLLLSPVTIDDDTGTTEAVGLAPLAVAPAHQRQGIGGRLVREAIAWLRGQGQIGVVVLGDPAYYPRFGFVPASEHGLRWEHPCPPEAFMVLELVPGALPRGGVVRYRPELGGSDPPS